MVTYQNQLRSILQFFEPFFLQGREVLDIFHIIFDSLFTVFLIFTFLITITYLGITTYMFLFGKQKKYQYVTDRKKFPTVTVHIPTYNELAAINCAKRCLAFDYPKEKLEIFIGDDSNKPEISKKFKEFAELHPQITVHKRKKNVGFKPGNLNNMLKYTKSDYILIFDSDYLPQKDFLKKL
ncbi:MAG: glycosyltransferase, partial [Candidatus Woesearchaeota archaeon]